VLKFILAIASYMNKSWTLLSLTDMHHFSVNNLMTDYKWTKIA